MECHAIQCKSMQYHLKPYNNNQYHSGKPQPKKTVYIWALPKLRFDPPYCANPALCGTIFLQIFTSSSSSFLDIWLLSGIDWCCLVLDGIAWIYIVLNGIPLYCMTEWKPKTFIWCLLHYIVCTVWYYMALFAFEW